MSLTNLDVDPARRARLLAASSAFLRLRPWIVAPVAGLALLVLELTPGVPAAQRRALGAGFAVMVSFFVAEARRYRTRSGTEVTENGLLASMLVTQLGIAFASVASGGALAPLLLAPTVVGVAAFGRGRASAALTAAAAAYLVVLALIPPSFPFPPLPAPAARGLGLASVVAAIALAAAGALSLGEAYARARAETDRAHEATLEEAAARGRALALLGAQVAHEIKNPLSAVQGLVELLAEGAGDDPKASKRLAVIAGEVARIERIVGDYLAYARPLGPREEARVDLGDLARRAAAVVEARARRTGARVEVDAEEAVTARVDPRRIEEALLNLLLNALEAGASMVRVGARAAGGAAVLTVADDGRGMSAAALARLGEPFHTTRAEGTGLGVVLARRTAERHGGSLEYASAEGRGTTATLTVAREEEAT